MVLQAPYLTAALEPCRVVAALARQAPAAEGPWRLAAAQPRREAIAGEWCQVAERVRRAALGR